MGRSCLISSVAQVRNPNSSIAAWSLWMCDVVSINTAGWFMSRQREPSRSKVMSGPNDDSTNQEGRDWEAGSYDPHNENPLDARVHRRVTVAVCWALARRAALDSRELYEDSFALSEEFREWLVSLEDHPDVLQANVLMVPRHLTLERKPETDGRLGI